MKILIINGANLNRLEEREILHYGNLTLDEIKNITHQKISSIGEEIKIDWCHSNIEGEIVNFIQSAIGTYDGIVINPGGYSHTSVVILDALHMFKGIKVEVHLSRATRRGDKFRETLITAQGSDILLEGMAELSYFMGVYIIFEKLKTKSK